MRFPVVFLVLTLLAGCTQAPAEEDPADGAGTSSDVPRAKQATLLDARFTVATGVPDSFEVEIPRNATNIVLFLTQDSGLIPNLHVELTGCGGADTPGAAGQQSVPLCDEASAGAEVFTVSTNVGLPSGAGRVVLVADVS